MSRSAAAAAQQSDRAIRRSSRPQAPRRISGPARPAYDPRRLDPRPRQLATPGPLRAVAGGGAAIAVRAADLAIGVSGSRAMDRLVRSRAWIVILGFGLAGIVAMQVSMLKLNSGIGRAVETSARLDRSNAALRLEVSQLSAADRVQRLAAAKGFAMPAPDGVRYLDAGDLAADGRRAARDMRAPLSSDAPPTPTAAAPAPPQADSAVLATGPGAPPKSATAAPATTTSAGAGGTAAAAPATGAPTAAQAPASTAAAGGTPATSTATASGGAAPPSSQATATGP